jgi:hypothetical protein
MTSQVDWVFWTGPIVNLFGVVPPLNGAPANEQTPIHGPQFMARVAMEAISGRKTIQEIAAVHPFHPIQVSEFKRQLLDSASDLFTRGNQSKDK